MSHIREIQQHARLQTGVELGERIINRLGAPVDLPILQAKPVLRIY